MYSLEQIFKYSPKEPLLFTQYLFWMLFSVFMLIYILVQKRDLIKKVALILFGLFFYYKSGGYFFILLLITTVTDFYFGKGIQNAVSPVKKKLYVSFSVGTNLALLLYFKYTGFFVDLLNQYFGTHLEVYNILSDISNQNFGTHFEVNSIFLPIGISFFTFQAISYAVDIYRGKIKALNNIIDYCFFVTYFPQILAGPIVRAVDFIPQIKNKYQLTTSDFGRSIVLILGGLFKKMVISDYISGNFVDRVFSQPKLYSGFENLMAVYGYTIQIYCDFSGYTDIAIGLALMMGYHLPLNFRSPYKSESITDFWRRWHISLSSWLKDYLYISLGGNRKGKFRQYLNLFLTMLIGGLWHGANLRFILWGGLHGLALAFHKGWMAIFPPKEEKSSIFSKLIFGILTFHFVAFCWIFFRATSTDIALEVLNRIGNHFDTNLILDVIYGYRKVFLVILLGYVLHLLPDDWTIRLQEKVTNISILILAPIIAIFVILIFQVISGAIQPFIYFQF